MFVTAVWKIIRRCGLCYHVNLSIIRIFDVVIYFARREQQRNLRVQIKTHAHSYCTARSALSLTKGK